MLLRCLVWVLALSFLASGIGLAGLTADGKRAKKPKSASKTRGVSGVVKAVEKDKDANSGFITIKIHNKKKNGQFTDKEEKYHFSAGTKFDRLLRVSKGENRHEAGTLTDVTKGAHVIISLDA